jgi:hypothetical protein
MSVHVTRKSSTGLLIKIREFHKRIEDEDFYIKFDEFKDLGEFDLFASKEPCSIRVRGLQVLVLGLGSSWWNCRNIWTPKDQRSFFVCFTPRPQVICQLGLY